MNDSELVTGLSDLVRRGNELTAEVLAHLAELEVRLIHLELGYPSAFAYCVQALGLSEAAAGRRLTGARVCRKFPEAFALVAKGDLHLSALCELGPHLAPTNASELFAACRRMSRRQIEGLLAVRFPKPDIRAQIRRIPVRTESPAQTESPARADSPPRTLMSRPASESQLRHSETESDEVSSKPAIPSQDHEPIDAEPPENSRVPKFEGAAGESSSSSANESVCPSPSRSAARRRREIEALSGDRFGVHFTADVELRELIERARALARHRLPNGELAALMKLALTLFVAHEEKRRFAVGTAPRRARRSAKEEPLPAAVLDSSAESLESPPRVTSTNTTEQSTDASVGGEAVVRMRPGCDAKRRSTPPGGVPSLSKNALGVSKRTRHVPAEVRRDVYARDQGRCSFVSADGRRCEARDFLEFDHIRPWAARGDTAVDNLRLLCRAHNALHARICFGAEIVAGKGRGSAA